MRTITTLLTVVSGILARTADAQALSATDVLPLVGDTFRYQGVENDELFDPGAAGTGITWDHAGLQINTGPYTQYAVIEPSSAPGLASYPTSDLVLERTISGTAFLDRFYYDQQAEGIKELGSIGDPLIYEYDLPDLVQPVPMLFDSVYTSAYCHYSFAFGATYHTCGVSQHILDGSGTLILPYGTFVDAKRTTFMRYHVPDDAPLDTSSVIIHRWWVPGVRRHILEMNVFTGANGVVLTSVTVMNASYALGMVAEGPVIAGVYPVPFTDRLLVELARPVRENGTVRIFGSDGRSLLNGTIPAGTSRLQLNVSDLPAAPIWLQLTADGARATRTLIHQR